MYMTVLELQHITVYRERFERVPDSSPAAIHQPPWIWPFWYRFLCHKDSACGKFHASEPKNE